MSKEQLLTELFDAHSKDLNYCCPGAGDQFVCPICLYSFPREAIANKELTDGHVWPKYIRKASNKVRNMRVLLCHECNHLAGGHGDARMQIHEHVRKGEETGRLYGARKLLLRKTGDDKPITMNVVNITRHLHDGSITVNWIANEDLTWRHNDPEDQSRFKEIYENQDRVEFLIHPHPLHNPDLAQAGWVTSSYLMAFHNLGYRFILNSTLNQVRDYIKSSFEGYIKDNPLAHELDDFGVWVRSPEYPINPELLFMAPLENGKRVYLQVNCLAYEIRLPFRFRMSVLYPILIRSIPNFQARISELQEKKQVIHFPVPYNKMVGDKSWYDDLLGNPVLKGLGENENEPR